MLIGYFCFIHWKKSAYWISSAFIVFLFSALIFDVSACIVLMGFLEFFLSVPLFYSRVSVPFIRCLILFFIIMVSRTVSVLVNSNFVLLKSQRDMSLRILLSWQVTVWEFEKETLLSRQHWLAHFRLGLRWSFGSPFPGGCLLWFLLFTC